MIAPATVDAGRWDQVIVTGAGGWVGRNAVRLAAVLSGDRGMRGVIAAGQRARQMVLPTVGMVDVVSMAQLSARGAPSNTLLLHCGFPTQDQVDAMGAGAYGAAIAALRTSIIDLIGCGDAIDVVYLSSGAATSVERGVEVARRTQLYGQAKLDDEAALRVAAGEVGGRLCVVRAFALSGPYMTKPDTYALGNMIFQALDAGAIEVLAARPVRRSYMAIDDMLRIAIDAVAALEPGESVTFETAGEVVEMGDLASRVLGALGHDPDAVRRPPLIPDAPPDDYLGDRVLLGALAARAGVIPAGLDEQIEITAAWLQDQSRP